VDSGRNRGVAGRTSSIGKGESVIACRLLQAAMIDNGDTHFLTRHEVARPRVLEQPRVFR